MCRAQAGIESGRVPGEIGAVLVFRAIHGRRRRGELAEEGAGSSCTGDHALRGGQGDGVSGRVGVLSGGGQDECVLEVQRANSGPQRDVSWWRCPFVQVCARAPRPISAAAAEHHRARYAMRLLV